MSSCAAETGEVRGREAQLGMVLLEICFPPILSLNPAPAPFMCNGFALDELLLDHQGRSQREERMDIETSFILLAV